MSHHVPKAGGILTLVGALALAGFLTVIDGGPANHFAWNSSSVQIVQNFATGAAYLSVVMGALILAAPERKTIWASVAIVAAILSLPFGFGAVIPPVLVVVGGVLTIRYKIAPMTSAESVSSPPGAPGP
jgi:hypothetical protein